VSPNLLLGIFYAAGQNPYARLLARPPDDRAGVFFIYRSPERVAVHEGVAKLWKNR
jgi:hypothetical protein